MSEKEPDLTEAGAGDHEVVPIRSRQRLRELRLLQLNYDGVMTKTGELGEPSHARIGGVPNEKRQGGSHLLLHGPPPSTEGVNGSGGERGDPRVTNAARRRIGPNIYG